MRYAMKTLAIGCAGALAAALTLGGAAPAAAAAKTAAPIVKQDWTFAGIFGQFDQAQLQRGFKIYQQACAACHSVDLIPFRTLTDETGPHFSEEAAEAIAAQYTVVDGPNDQGEMFERPAELTDTIPPPYPNQQAAMAANGGAYPPDLSLIAKARAAYSGFPAFVFEPFTLYAEQGPDYIYNLLTGYEEAPEGADAVAGKWYNPVFMAGPWISMPPPLVDGQVEYTDGTPETVEQYSKDIAAFLMWAAEPKLEERKELGFRVIVFLAVFLVLMYLTKRKIWSQLKH